MSTGTEQYKRPKDIYDFLRRMRGTDLTATERSVLMAQYSYADKDGTNSYASEETLAADLGISVRTVRRQRKDLRAKGWLIERSRGRNLGETQTASRYEVVIPAAPVVVAAKRVQAVSNPTGRNQHTVSTGQSWPLGLQDNSRQDPSSLQAKNDHLPTQPIDDHRSSNIGVVDQSAPQGGAGGNACEGCRTKDPWLRHDVNCYWHQKNL